MNQAAPSPTGTCDPSGTPAPRDVQGPKIDHGERRWGRCNWLVHRIFLEHLRRAAEQYAGGELVDVGCGRKPWREVFAPYVEAYTGVDHADTQHDIEFADVVADAYHTTLANESADTVVSLAVLEHLEEPSAALQEMHRLLRPGGYLILTAPLFWHVHEAPRDFYRYTPDGLRHLLAQAGLEVVEVTPMSGFWVTFLQEMCYWLEPKSRRRLLRFPVNCAMWALQQVGWWIHPYDASSDFSWMHLAVARRPAVAQQAEAA